MIFENVAKEKEIRLSANIPNELRIFADLNALETVIRDLVDNALKYTPRGGLFSVNAHNIEKGMSSEQVHNIFLLKKEKSQKGLAGEKGTSLGLHLVNELVKLNKGTIQVLSHLGKGTKYNLVFPRKSV